MFSKSKNSDHEIHLTISTKTFLRLALLTVLCVAFVQALRIASGSLMLLSVAFFLALALNGPVNWVARHLPGRKKGSRTLATSISFLVVIAFLGLFIASIVPPLVKQTSSFLNAAPDLVKDIRDQDSATGRFIRQYNLEENVDALSTQISDKVKGSGGETIGILQSVGSSIFATLSIVVLTFMMLIEGPRWIDMGIRVFPRNKRPKAKRLANDMYKVVKGFVNGQVTLAAIAAILILPVILLLGISYPIALMVIIFICGLIPMVGHTIGAIIVSVVALFESSSAALIILAYYFLYQQLENYFVQPKIQANATNMSPLLVFAAVIVGISFGGLAGGLFAIPVAGVLRILILDYMRSNDMIEESEYKEEITSETK